MQHAVLILEDVPAAREVLATDQADQQDTIRAVDQAGLDHGVTGPWDADDLPAPVRGDR